MKFKLFVAALAPVLAAPLPAYVQAAHAQAAKTDKVYAGCMIEDARGGNYYHSKLVELPVKPFVMDPQGYPMSNHYYRSQTALNAQFLAYLTSKGMETYGLGCRAYETREKVEEWEKSMEDVAVGHNGLQPVLITDWEPKPYAVEQ